jgi:hypothetical protein
VVPVALANAALASDAVYEGFRPTHAGDGLWGIVNLLALVGGFRSPGIGVFFLLATATIVVGTILFGMATTRTKIYANWTGTALIVSGVLALVALVLRFAMPSLNAIVADVPYSLFFATLGAMGYWLGMMDNAKG